MTDLWRGLLAFPLLPTRLLGVRYPIPHLVPLLWLIVFKKDKLLFLFLFELFVFIFKTLFCLVFDIWHVFVFVCLFVSFILTGIFAFCMHAFSSVLPNSLGRRGSGVSLWWYNIIMCPLSSFPSFMFILCLPPPPPSSQL